MMQRARVATASVITLVATMFVPGTVQAHHTSCTAQGSSDPYNQVPNACPEFSPGFDLSVNFPYRDVGSSINLELSQADHESSTLSWEWFLPTGWRFNTTIRPAEAAAGGPASSCTDLFDSDGSAPRAEAVSAGNLLSTWSGTDRTIKDYTLNSKPVGLYFWKSVGTTTTLCFQFRNAPTRKWTSPMTIERVDLGSESPYGWKVTVPVETLQNQPWFNNNTPANTEDDYSLRYLDLELGWLTSGTWNLANGIPARTVFSRAPRNPVQTKIGTRAIACSNGANTLAACSASGNQGSPIAYPYDGELHEFPVAIMEPPVYGPMPWAKIARAGDTVVPGRGRLPQKPVKGFGFSDDVAANGNRLSITWTALGADDLPLGVTATGYVLAVHKVTAHQSPYTADEIAAGRVLFARDFSNETGMRSISFNLMDMPENQQLGSVEGKYNVSLVTVYDMAKGTGYRSDGSCDGPTSGSTEPDFGLGVPCPPNRPAWLAEGTPREDGTSLFQVLVRADRWPLRYRYTVSGQPFSILLLDVANKRAEYTIWGAATTASAVTAPTTDEAPAGNVISPIVDPLTADTLAPVGDAVNTFVSSFGGGIADQGASTVFRASSDVILGPTGPAGGVVRFGSFDLESESLTWDFTGTFSGTGTATRGRFTMYNAKGADLDWLRVNFDPNDPTGGLEPGHNGDCVVSIVGCPSGTPRMVIGNFDGIAF